MLLDSNIFPMQKREFNLSETKNKMVENAALSLRSEPSVWTVSSISDRVCVCVSIELSSFDYAPINLAIQPGSIDISSVFIHHQLVIIPSAILTLGVIKNSAASSRSIRQTAPAAQRAKVIMIDQDLCRCCSAVSLLGSLCQGFL